MFTTPELVRAEVAYRLERAYGGVEPEHLRAARQRHRSWWRRATGDPGGPSRPVNEVRPAV